MKNRKSHDRAFLSGRKVFSLAVVCCALAGVVWPPPDSHSKAAANGIAIEEYIQHLESSYRDVGTLKAHFRQTYSADRRKRVESGTVYFARGGRMRWDYKEPEEKLFLSNGKRLELYLPEERQLTVSSVKTSEDARVPFRLLLSRVNLRKVFGPIEFDDQALKAEPLDRVLRALPKRGEEDDFRDVLMELTPSFDVRRLVIGYPDRSTMEFTFEHWERNVSLNPDLFRFTPPEGTEVIEQR